MDDEPGGGMLQNGLAPHGSHQAKRQAFTRAQTDSFIGALPPQRRHTKEYSDNGHHHENFDKRKGATGKAIAPACYSQLNIHFQSGLPDELSE